MATKGKCPYLTGEGGGGRGWWTLHLCSKCSDLQNSMHFSNIFWSSCLNKIFYAHITGKIIAVPHFTLLDVPVDIDISERTEDLLERYLQVPGHIWPWMLWLLWTGLPASPVLLETCKQTTFVYKNILLNKNRNAKSQTSQKKDF